MDPALFENLRLELRRGCLIVAVLAALRTEQYGYTLRKLLGEQGLNVDEGTLYPLLRRLETQGLLVSEWREEGKRNKRFYRLSADGMQAGRQAEPYAGNERIREPDAGEIDAGIRPQKRADVVLRREELVSGVAKRR